MTEEEIIELRSKLAVLGELADRMREERANQPAFDKAVALFEEAFGDTHAFVEALAAKGPSG